MSDRSNVKKYWILLLGLYIVSTFFVGVLNSFSGAAGEMLVPIAVGAGLLRWASSAIAVRNIYITISLLLIYFIFNDYNQTRNQIVSDASYGCENNNKAVDSSVSSDKQKLEYCGCMAEELANLILLRTVQHRILLADYVLKSEDFAKDLEMKISMVSAQKICSARVSG